MHTPATAFLKSQGISFSEHTYEYIEHGGAERGAEATNIFQGCLLLVSGVYYPVEILPGWLQPLAKLSPATYSLSACRKLMGIGSEQGQLVGAPISEVTPELLTLALMGMVMVPLGLWVFGQVERWAKKTGKLKRTG